jgi:hypothetical protein
MDQEGRAMRSGILRRAPRSLALSAFAIASAIAMLPLAAGASSASASTSHSAAPQAVTWHKLKLLNRWASQQPFNNSGDPAWAMQNGIVYLSGSLQQLTGSTKDEFAVLPPAARPAKIVIVPASVAEGFEGHVEVMPSGALLAASAPAKAARGFTSLAAISFPAAQTHTRHLTLLHGWQPGPSAWKTAAPASINVHGIVYLSGVMRHPHGSNPLFAVLPKGSRPSHVLWITVYTQDHTTGSLEVLPAGAMYAFGSDSALYTSLNGVSFPDASVVSHDLTLIGEWESGQPTFDTGDPAYSIIDGVVHLSGSLELNGTTDSPAATIPAKARPKHAMWIDIYTKDGTVGQVIIGPDGIIDPGGITNFEKFSSLASISYPLGS